MTGTESLFGLIISWLPMALYLATNIWLIMKVVRPLREIAVTLRGIHETLNRSQHD
ncbi:hypothetical protein [Mesorhizobium sp. AA23]|uniref:hypothetical protein n=1 Tax=Mesorhizobium sp. AA23 TaxID=1854058 RepID=UPI0012EA31AC|nr:hypothetical protein [Mesorhizobium sp. AA23]